MVTTLAQVFPESSFCRRLRELKTMYVSNVEANMLYVLFNVLRCSLHSLQLSHYKQMTHALMLAFYANCMQVNFLTCNTLNV